jgi:Uma2 family endonuclease
MAQVKEPGMSLASFPTATFDSMVLPPEPVKRWTVAEYHELIRLGLLNEEDPYELIEGWLVTKMMKNPPHDSLVNFLSQSLIRILPPDWSCRTQSAVTLADGEPELDIAIVQGSPLEYRNQHPGPAQVGLVIEVADSSYARDRGIKLRSYARAGIGEYWIVNLQQPQIEVYTKPKPETSEYTERKDFTPGQSVLVVLAGQQVGEIAVAQLF